MKLRHGFQHTPKGLRDCIRTAIQLGASPNLVAERNGLTLPQVLVIASTDPEVQV